jgi:hypothetical protein
MPIGCLFDESRIINECCVTAVYDAMYRVYFYAATDKKNRNNDSFSLELYWESSLALGENRSLL